MLRFPSQRLGAESRNVIFYASHALRASSTKRVPVIVSAAALSTSRPASTIGPETTRAFDELEGAESWSLSDYSQKKAGDDATESSLTREQLTHLAKLAVLDVSTRDEEFLRQVSSVASFCRRVNEARSSDLSSSDPAEGAARVTSKRMQERANATALRPDLGNDNAPVTVVLGSASRVIDGAFFVSPRDANAKSEHSIEEDA